MVWLTDGENFLKICLFVLTQSTNVTDTHTYELSSEIWYLQEAQLLQRSRTRLSV